MRDKAVEMRIKFNDLVLWLRYDNDVYYECVSGSVSQNEWGGDEMAENGILTNEGKKISLKRGLPSCPS